MAKKAKSLSQWCNENNQKNLLSEIDPELNGRWYTNGYIPDRIEYCSSIEIGWKCNNNHKWLCEVAARTMFGLKCPICYPDESILPIGSTYGCLTIIGDFNDYYNEVAVPEIKKLEKEREDFLNGIRSPFSNVDSVDFYDHWIEEYKNRKMYKCKCKCGKTDYYDQSSFLEKKRRFCTQAITEKALKELSWSWNYFHKTPFSEDEALNCYCGLAVNAWKSKQKTYKANGRKTYAENYDTDYSGTFFESLEVLECIDDNLEECYSHGDLRKKNAYHYKIYKLYKCRCYLCGKEHNVKCSQFHISPPTPYGSTAYHGYWSGVQCDCHKISSFQWILNKLLIENNVSYRVEYSFDDLYGLSGTFKLRYDFAILNKDGSVKLLIECQGEQHTMPVEEFGGISQHNIQIKNDERKREYAHNHNIPLLEISYKDKKYEKVENILKEHKII